jgi:hypothetical protein
VTFSGVASLRYLVRPSGEGQGFVVGSRLVCRIVSEIDEDVVEDLWKWLLVRKSVTDLGPWGRGKLVSVLPVRSVTKALRIVSGIRGPLPRNLSEVSPIEIIDAYGHPKEIFRLHGDRCRHSRDASR